MTKLRSAIVWTLAGNAIYAGCQWAMLVVVAKLGSADALGSFALAFALTAPVMVLSNLQLRAVQATDARGEFRFGHYFALRLITTGVALVACVLLGWLRMSGPLLGCTLLIAAAKAIESVSDILYGFLQRRQDMRSIAVSMIAKGFLSLAALGATLSVTGSLPLACLALACSWAIIFGLYDLPVARTLLLSSGASMRPIWTAPTLAAMAMLALPLGLVMGIISLQVNVPRYMIGASFSVADVGAFAAIASLGLVGSTICNAVGQVASPRLADDYAGLERKSFLATTGKLLVVAFTIGAAGVAAAGTIGGWLLKQLFRPEYERLQDVFLILMSAACIACLASALGYALTAARQFRLQVPIYAAALAVTAAVCAWLTPVMGLRGAAIGAAAGSLTQLLGAAWALAWTIGWPFSEPSLPPAGAKPVRILHVLGGMDRAGVETWLMHLLRTVDRSRFQMDFLVHAGRPCEYDEEIESLGSRVLACASPSNPIGYGREFLRILRQHGPYDAVHSHVHHYSGLVLRLARLAGVPTRIAHSHTDTATIDSRGSLLRRLYLWTGRRWISRHASWKLAASHRAAACLFGPAWQSDPATSVLYCGLNFDSFAQPVDRASVRRELGFAESDFVIGHVGRFAPVKNHDLLLQIHAEALKLRPDARLLLIGQGPLEDAIRATAVRLGTADRICFAGARSDVARLMIGAMDAFVMPSLFEGLGLAAVEAQAAGLPAILSDQIPADVDAQCGLVRFVGLDDSPAKWASVILQHAAQTRTSRNDALTCVNRSPFNIQHSARTLCQLYS